MEVREIGKVLHLTYSSSLFKLCEVNSSFDSGVLRVAYKDKNRNGSFISKETFERCMKTIYNCPIVCNYDRDTDSIGAHDVEIVKSANGDLRLVNVTTPIGVVPESAKTYWEEVEEEDGSVHEYLCTEALLWKRQEAYKKIKDDGISAESMEITVKDGEIDSQSGLFVIKDFEFTAFCILGSDVEPCFESASLEVFSHSEFKRQMEQMVAELKETFTMVNSHESEIDITTNHSTEGGEVLDEKMALVAEYGLDADALDFSLEDFSMEELREKFDALKNNESTNDTVVGEEQAEQPQETFELAGNFSRTLAEALESEKVDTGFGEMPKYWYVDYDPDLAEVYCHDMTDGWKLYGFSYTMNGDNVVIDFESKKRMKFAIVAFDEGEQEMPFASAFNMAVETYAAKNADWTQRYQAASEKIANLENDLQELDELRSFKVTTEKAQQKDAADKLFSSFEDLVGIEAYEALKNEYDKFSLEQLEEKCYAIRGRNGTHATFSLEPKAPKLPVNETKLDENEPYGGAVLRYSSK